MKLKSATIVFIITSILFLSICLFDIVEGNANMGVQDAMKMVNSLGKGKDGAMNAENIEKMINNMGGISKILQTFGNMNTTA